MKTLPFICLGISFTLMTSLAARDADDMDPDAKAAVDEARKSAAEAGVKLPDTKALMGNGVVPKDTDDKKSDDEKEVPVPPPTKPVPLKALPAWIPPIANFKPAPGATQWTEDGKNKGQMTGVVTGVPRESAAEYEKAAKATGKFSVSSQDSDINGNITLTVSLMKIEGPETSMELELKPAKDGKSSTATITYSVMPPAAKPL